MQFPNDLSQMAFYPDELSPIDRIRSLGKQADSLTDVSSIKNRRQWKSLVLGKKDIGMNNFATIAEEKEDEMSSDGSQEAQPGTATATAVGVVANKKITFPKPRKYITSRVSDRRDDLRGVAPPVPFPLGNAKEPESVEVKKPEPSIKPETKKPPKSKEIIAYAQDFIQNYALNDTPIESQWNEAFSSGLNWTKPTEKPNTKHEPIPKLKSEEKRKPIEPTKPSNPTEEPKTCKKKTSPTGKKTTKGKKEPPPTTTTTGSRSEKGKSLNMKEVVNVYKNLAYGSKEEIKTFVENLSFVKDESKAENDKDLLSMMNLKALENKIKNFTKKTTKNSDPSSAYKEKKPKLEKTGKKNRKAHIERLARHKIVKVPAVLTKKPKTETTTQDKAEQRKKTKEPWKYVGMESALDKTYFVYPAYPPSVNLKNNTKPKKVQEKTIRQTKPTTKSTDYDPKVKSPQVILRPSLISRLVSGSSSTKSITRPSATTVCTVEFRPTVGQKGDDSPLNATTDQSLLVYLHGTKAIHVNSPYADKQFSRVKFFRKSERGMPLVKGLGPRPGPKDPQTVSVRNISLPDKLTRFRSIDLLDFDEDIENITDFLRSQDTPERHHSGNWELEKKTERPKETTKDQSTSNTTRQHQQRRRSSSSSSQHQPGTPKDSLSPDSIINEITKNIQHLQYLPDTEDNRKLIGQFFDELDNQIEASRKGAMAFRSPVADSFSPIPILGY